MERYSVAIIGAGITGASVAERLSRYDLSVALVEKETDVSFGTSKANSGIIHGGFHHDSRYVKARLEVRGAEMYPHLHRDLGFPYKQCGIVVAAFTPEELTIVNHLYRTGVANGAAGIEVAGPERIRELEPKLSEEVIGGLYAPAGGIIEPYRFVFALVESAQLNGVELVRDFRVSEASRDADGVFTLRDSSGRGIRADYVVNAAGLYADEVSEILGGERFTIEPRKGEYHLLDRRTPACPSRVVFPVPTTLSKGMLVIPTVEGTVLIGPTADPVRQKSDVGTNADRLNQIIQSAKKLVPLISPKDVISSFAGLRPTLPSGDFCVERSEKVDRLVQVAGIQSPGLTAAPAIGEYVKDLLLEAGVVLRERPGYRTKATRATRTRLFDDNELRDAWEADPAAGDIVCRCETVSHADISRAVAAGHTCLDSIKFHSRAMAGRCQGAFCLPKIVDILEAEAGLAPEEITKRGGDSLVVKGRLDGTERPANKLGRRGAGGNFTVGGGGSYGARRYDALVIGGGAAGMAAASELAQAGNSVVVIDREARLGGVLRQCIHNGFGLHEFREELTGPEYAERYVDEVGGLSIDTVTDTTVLSVDQESDDPPKTDAGSISGSPFVAHTVSYHNGPQQFVGDVVVLAMGSRERNRGSIQTPGTRPSGLFTAGAAQRLVNQDGLVPGRRAVVVGSGDIGLIMARRMRLIGSEVAAVIEIQPVPSGINRNIVQCLNDFAIPLYLGHVVSEIQGADRVSGVRVSPLENGVPRDDKSFLIDCDTVLFSIGLVPENELSREMGVRLHSLTNGPVVDANRMTSVRGVFAAGNVLHVHDLVDYVAEEARLAGQAAAEYLRRVRGEKRAAEAADRIVEVAPGQNVRYLTPGGVLAGRDNLLYMRTLVDKTDTAVDVIHGAGVVKHVELPHVQPSEMIRLKLGPRDLSDLPPDARLEVHIR